MLCTGILVITGMLCMFKLINFLCTGIKGFIIPYILFIKRSQGLITGWYLFRRNYHHQNVP